MAGINLSLLLKMLREITHNEISEKSLCHVLLLTGGTAKNLLYGKTLWPERWSTNAKKIMRDNNDEYKKRRALILRERTEWVLTASEREQLKKVEDEFMQELLTVYKNAGIYHLENCCYFPDSPDSKEVHTFESKLTDLIDSVLDNGKKYWGTPGKDAVLDYLRRCSGFEEEIKELEGMEKSSDIASYLVSCAKESKKRAVAKKETAKMEMCPSDVARLLRYEDLKQLGLTAWDIAQNLVENDLALYPDVAPENEGKPELWMEYLSRYPETFVYLVDPSNKIVGNWSFLSITEEQERAMEAGELFEITFDIQNTECLFLPGDYVLYLLNFSCNEAYAKAQYYQALLDELWKQLLDYAENGIYFKRICINLFHPAYEALWRGMGFQFLVKNRISGRIYAQSMVPFPFKLKAKDPTILSELKKRYDEHFTV